VKGQRPGREQKETGANLRNTIILLMVAMLAFGMASCASRQESGAVIGAVTGAVVGNQFGSGAGRALATAAGAVVGGIVGSEIGRKLDKADRRRAAAAEYYALEEEKVGSSRDWRSPDSGHRGEVVITREYRRNGRPCRDYEHTIYIDGEPDILTGTSCRGEDGRWRSTG
jgi:surface antigen